MFTIRGGWGEDPVLLLLLVPSDFTISQCRQWEGEEKVTADDDEVSHDTLRAAFTGGEKQVERTWSA